MPESRPRASEPVFEKASAADLVGEADLQRLFEYWRAKRQGRRMPSMRDIDPIEISWALSRIFLIDYTPSDGFVYRLAGEEVASAFGHSNLKGLRLEDVVTRPERQVAVEGAWRRAVEAQCVISMKGMVYYGANRMAMGERLVLPLTNDMGDSVTTLLGMTVCEWTRSSQPVAMQQPDFFFTPVSEIP